ncbi:hypothetical protein N7519_003420 [Penicillium mononematosum]|uniref:uncharacterized protein n=1 Tax=Penicillium mononematosum TaxID=268346 RepID=UPI0025493273|nr:uncharacterized protein N7519_003420 [Penicillium mononematosum]KAJ6188512.1 hypothetical protein N7519_003420 [Penicillium mononematosum]
MESPMKAVVGKNKIIVYVHPSALMQGTSALTARVTGPWSNIGQQTLDWTDFDEETIECVLKFCYGRQYDLPWQSPPTKDESTIVERAGSHAEHNAESGSELASWSYTGDAIVLHAKVYLFAHRYLVDALQQYALAQMKNCFGPFLEEYSTSPAQQFNTPSSSPESNMDPARKELCDFVADSHQRFSRHFVQFHEETGDFMVDLACNLAARITVLQSSNAYLATECQRRNAELIGLVERFWNQGPRDSFFSIPYQQGRD